MDVTRHRAYLEVTPLVRKSGIHVYISLDAARYINITSLEELGLNVTIFDVNTFPKLEQKSILIVNVTDFSHNPAAILSQLIDSSRNTSHLVIVVLNPNRDEVLSKKAMQVMLKYYGYRHTRPLLILEPPKDSGKSHRALEVKRSVFTAQALVFSINPIGMVVVYDITDFEQTLLLVVKWARLINIKDAEGNATFSGIFGSPSMLSIENFKHVGYVGWITSNFIGSDCGEITGYMAVKVDYYYANRSTSIGVYHAWLAHIEHSAKGYQTLCCNPWPFCFTYNHYPKVFVSKTDWNTDMWPGQVLDDHQPKNAGTAKTVTYTIAWQLDLELGGEAKAVVSYTALAVSTTSVSPYYEWYDISDPPLGVAAAKHYLKVPSTVDESKLSGVLFTVESSSIGFLDPNRDGGFLPMIVSHEFETTLNTGDKASISFSVELWPDTIVEG
ncbi:hypothetical protein [Pyrolobus fumarii]|uniref:hypothetical protein n=1 Tax=Pyrolobus fumarii TaxID=54252 RepID=UPI0014332A66|nr:hypothetical protein [Pyrolobus fumarii]